MIDKTQLELLKKQMPVSVYVARRFGLPVSDSFVISCPFHNERTPSCQIRKDFWKCFGCGIGGDIYSFIMNLDKVSFTQAAETVAEILGVELNTTNNSGVSKTQAKAVVKRYAQLAFEEYDQIPDSHPAKQEVLKRRIVLPSGTVGFLSKPVGVSKELGVPSGICAKGGAEIFVGRLIFPIFNTNGDIVAFSGRKLEGVDTILPGKYVNSPNTSILYDKSRDLYGIEAARTNQIIVCEGQFDVLAWRAVGLDAVAPLGTAITKEHINRLSAKTKDGEIVLCFDKDQAGINACVKALKDPYLKAYAKMVSIQNDDPSTTYASNPELLKVLFNQRKLAVQAILELILSLYTDNPEEADYKAKGALEAIDASPKWFNYWKSIRQGVNVPPLPDFTPSNQSINQTSTLSMTAASVLLHNPQIIPKLKDCDLSYITSGTDLLIKQTIESQEVPANIEGTAITAYCINPLVETLVDFDPIKFVKSYLNLVSSQYEKNSFSTNN